MTRLNLIEINSAPEFDRPIYDLINVAVRQVFAEDYEDLKAFHESNLDFETVLKQLKSSSKL